MAARHRWANPLRPGQHNDHYVRVYRQTLLALAAAGDDAAQQRAVFREYPHVCQAHRLHYSPDVEQQQILEARLLTDETIEEIAIRFGTAPQVIDYYEKLFFHVRDRLQCSGWIRLMVLGPRNICRGNMNSAMTVAERGYVLRLFAYFGGPLVLDAAISGIISTTMPRSAEEVGGWFDETLNQIVLTCAAAAAASLRLNQQNMLQVIRLALRKGTAKSVTRANDPHPHFEEWAEQVLSSIGREPTGQGEAELAQTQNS